MTQTDVPPVQQDVRAAMWEMIVAYRTSQVVRCAAAFSLAEHCAAGPVTAERVATAEGTDLRFTARLLRACTALGLLTYTTEDGFRGTALLDILRRDAEGSQWGFALSLPGPIHWRPWGQLPEAVRTGRTQLPATLDRDTFFGYLAAHGEEAEPFYEGLNGLTAVAGAEAARVIDTSDVRQAVDVGGGVGLLMHDLMAINPTLRGVVFDLPEVAAQATTAAAERGLSDRIEIVAGDFFDAVPAGADMYLLRYVLHDWDDDSCIRILRSCRAVMAPGARLYVLEMLLGELGDEDPLVPMQDLNMMAICPGMERTVADFDALFTAAGLRRTEVISTDSPMSVIVVAPV